MGPCVYFLWDQQCLLLINWTLVKFVFMKSLWVTMWCISYGTLTITHRDWSLVKCESINSLWNHEWWYIFLMATTSFVLSKLNFESGRYDGSWNGLMGPYECISYGTLPITHKLNFCQIWVHNFIMGPCVRSILMVPFLLRINWTLAKWSVY